MLALYRQLSQRPYGLRMRILLIAAVIFFAAAANAERQAREVGATIGSAAFSPGFGNRGEWYVKTRIGVECRIYAGKPAFPEQPGGTLSPSTFIEPEIIYEWNDGDERLKLQPYARYDRDDKRRSHVDLRQAYWLHIGRGYDFVIGLDKVFWGVNESRHLVDIINQTDLVEDIDGEDKLGQSMIQLSLRRNWGTTTAFVMPRFRERNFAGRKARLRGVLPIATDGATYDSSKRKRAVDFAIRYAGVIGNIDLGISHFHGTSREPRFFFGLGKNGFELRPHYDRIDQTGIDIQYTTESWLWKIEVMGRRGHGDYFGAAVAGFEYTFYQPFGTSFDFGILAEYLYDARDEDGSAPLATLENDIFAGMRLTFNNEQDTNIFGGAVVDIGDGATSFSIEATHRLGANWKLEAVMRAFLWVPRTNPLTGVREDDYLSLGLTRYF